MAYVDKTAKCSQCGENVELIIQGRAATWRHPGLVPHPMHDASPDRDTIREAGQ